MMDIVYAVAALGGMGALFGVLLAVASHYLKVDTDERIPLIIEVLPSANCGGCGYAGCGAFAAAIVEGKANPNACPVGGNEVAQKIGEILGKRVKTTKQMVAKVLCMGKKETAVEKYQYQGVSDCVAAAKLAGGPKACEYGCMGLGSCVDVCKFGAIKVVRGVAVVDEDKCTACKMCIGICPKKVIELVPKENNISVLCSSHDKGADVKVKCTVGCIGCKICEKTCELNAITVNNCKAAIDYDKCTSCGKCVQKCPKKIIHMKE